MYSLFKEYPQSNEDSSGMGKNGKGGNFMNPMGSSSGGSDEANN